MLISGQTVCRIERPDRSNLQNYYDRITGPLIERIEDSARGRAVVLKTHGPLLPDTAQLIAHGRVKAVASIRDPREMALSMMDNGRRARKLGVLAFSEIVEVADTLPSIDVQLNYFRAWAAVPQVEVFAYNDICFATDVVVARLCRQIGVDVNCDHVLRPFQNGRLIGEINRAMPRRYTEMSDAVQEVFLQRYAGFYGETDLREAAIESGVGVEAGNRGVFSHRVGNALRLVRRLFLTRSLGVIPSDDHV